MPYRHSKVPDDLKRRIKELMDEGLGDGEIASRIHQDAKEANITTEEELMRSIGSIRKHHTKNQEP
jgi:hypothetical protein